MAISEERLDLNLTVDGSSIDAPIFQTQAAYLAGKVSQFIKAQSSCVKSCIDQRFWELDSILRPLSIAAIQQKAKNKDTPCITSPLILT